MCIVFPHMAPNMLTSCCQSVTRCLPHQALRVMRVYAKRQQMVNILVLRAIETDTSDTQAEWRLFLSVPLVIAQPCRDCRDVTCSLDVQQVWQMWCHQHGLFLVTLIPPKWSGDCCICTFILEHSLYTSVDVLRSEGKPVNCSLMFLKMPVVLLWSIYAVVRCKLECVSNNTHKSLRMKQWHLNM